MGLADERRPAVQSAAQGHPTQYEATIPAVIADVEVSPSGPASAEAEATAAAIVRLDGHATETVGASEVGTVQAILLRSESAASSQIEHLRVGAKQLALAKLGVSALANAHLVAANVEAMSASVTLSDHLDADSILAMHAALLRHSRPQDAGRWRSQQVWIGSSSISPADAVFVPAHHDRVPDAVAELVDFMRRDDLPVVVQAAIAHALFGTIHPFPHGNGRTGRALLHALLRNKGLIRRVTVPISSGLLTDTRGYFEALTSYRSGDIEPIVLRVSEASQRAAAGGAWLVDELDGLHRRWKGALSPRGGSAAARLLPALLSQPAVDIAWVRQHLDVSFTAAARAIEQITSAGILAATSDRRRNRVWIAREVLDSLDDFAATAGRRW